VWEAAMADCRHALLQLQKAKAIQHSSLATPEQAISQCHPSSALEFRLRAQGATTAEGVVGVAGFAEAAQMEVDKRLRTCQRTDTESGRTMVQLWLDRARQAAEIAQELKQAAIEAVGLWEAALYGGRLQDLHREIDEELAVLEDHHSVLNAAVSCMSTWTDRYDQLEKIEEALKQIKATEERKTQLTMFVNKIKSDERKEERRKSKEISLCNHTTST
jgi:hypothetical protein